MKFSFFSVLEYESGFWSLMDSNSILYEEDNDITLSYSIPLITLKSGKKKLLSAFYTEEKRNQIKSFCKTHSLEEYPLVVTYYKKSGVLERVDLAENVKYSDSFVKDFMKLREII